MTSLHTHGHTENAGPKMDEVQGLEIFWPVNFSVPHSSIVAMSVQGDLRRYWVCIKQS